MSAFDDALAKAQDAEDFALGEQIQIVPMIAGEFMSGASADGGRPVRTVVGTFVETNSRMKMTDSPVGRDFDSQFVTSPKTVFIAERQLMVNGVLTLPKQRDRIVRLEHGNETFEIAAATERDDAGRRIIRLADIDA